MPLRSHFTPHASAPARYATGSRYLLTGSTLALAALGVVAGCGDDNKDVVGPGGGKVASVELVPSQLMLLVGGTVPLEFVAKKADGTPIDGVTPRWRTSDASHVTVNNSGIITANAPGGPVEI